MSIEKTISKHDFQLIRLASSFKAMKYLLPIDYKKHEQIVQKVLKDIGAENEYTVNEVLNMYDLINGGGKLEYEKTIKKVIQEVS